jgi:protein SCO1/2
MKNTALVFWLTLALAAIVSYGGWVVYRHAKEQSAEASTLSRESDVAQLEADRMRMNIPADGPSVPTFKLTDQDGKEFDSQSLRGKVWVGSIFFASCPGQCYQLNQALAGLQTDTELADVRFVSITCDPTNDTPDVLKQYAARFDANLRRWSFLTGPDDAAVQKVGTNILTVQIQQRAHRDDAVMLDRQSRIRGYFHLTNNGDVEKLRKRLKSLLAEKDAAPSSGTK